MNPSEGRVPVSWNECADWLEWFGREAVWSLMAEGPTHYTADEHRSGGVEHRGGRFSDYRLLPPPGLVAAPEGMDGGGWLGEGRHVPEGWEWRVFTDGPYCKWTAKDERSPAGSEIVQCRPPVRVRDVVEVPLTRLVGRTIEGEEVPVWSFYREADGWHWSPDKPEIRRFPAGSLDLDTGRVRVYAEGDEK